MVMTIAAATIGILLGFVVARFLLACIDVWVETVKYNRVREEERPATFGIIKVEELTPAPNPRYAYVRFTLSDGRVIKRAIELPDDLRWR